MANDDIVNVDGETSNISTGAGDDTILAEGASINNTSTGSGDDSVTLDDSNANNINTGSGDDSVTLLDDSTADKINTGSGDDSVTVIDSTFDWINTGSDDDEVILNSVVIDDENGGNVELGNGDDSAIIIDSVNVTVTGANGNDDITSTNNKNLIVNGDVGQDWLSSTDDKDSYFNLGEGEDTAVMINCDNNELLLGAGADTVTLINTDLFEHYILHIDMGDDSDIDTIVIGEESKGPLHVTIDNFSPEDLIDLSGAKIASFEDLQISTKVLDDGTPATAVSCFGTDIYGDLIEHEIIFKDLMPEDLGESNFKFADKDGSTLKVVDATSSMPIDLGKGSDTLYVNDVESDIQKKYIVVDNGVSEDGKTGDGNKDTLVINKDYTPEDTNQPLNIEIYHFDNKDQIDLKDFFDVEDDLLKSLKITPLEQDGIKFYQVSFYDKDGSAYNLILHTDPDVVFTPDNIKDYFKVSDDLNFKGNDVDIDGNLILERSLSDDADKVTISAEDLDPADPAIEGLLGEIHLGDSSNAKTSDKDIVVLENVDKDMYVTLFDFEKLDEDKIDLSNVTFTAFDDDGLPYETCLSYDNLDITVAKDGSYTTVKYLGGTDAITGELYFTKITLMGVSEVDADDFVFCDPDVLF